MTGRLVIVRRNAEPARTVKRAGLRVEPPGGIDWAKLKRDAEAFRKRTERYVEANRRFKRHVG